MVWSRSATDTGKVFLLPFLSRVMSSFFYAVKSGRTPGVYSSWAQCEAEVFGFPAAVYKKFSTKEAAWEFIHHQDHSVNSITPTVSEKIDPSSFQKMEQNSVMKNNKLKMTLLEFQRQLKNMVSLSSELLEQINDNEQEDFGHLAPDIATLGKPLVNSKINLHNKQRRDCRQELKRSFSSGVQSLHNPKRMKKNFPGNWTGVPFDDDEKAVNVYTDGGCYQNGKCGARAGIGVYWGPSHKDNVSERLTGRQTNNRAEIHAACRAVQQAKAKGIKNLILHTDSTFLINSITKWIKGWKGNDWILTSGGPVVNKEDFLKLDQLLDGISVKWIHVRGHRGDPGNEAADVLATKGSLKPVPQ